MSRAAVEALIDADPAADDPYLVLADLLTEAGDPRGELILLQHRHHFDARHDELLRMLEPPMPPFGAIEWHCGFVKAARGYFLEDERERLEEFLAHPSTRFIQSLDVRVDGGEHDRTRWLMPALVEAPCGVALRALSLRLERTEAITVPRGMLDLTTLATAAPALRRLDAIAHWIKLDAPGPAHLTHVMLDGRITGGDVASFVTAAPQLTRLEVRDIYQSRRLWEALEGGHVLEELFVAGDGLNEMDLPSLSAAHLDRPKDVIIPDAFLVVRMGLRELRVFVKHALPSDERRYNPSPT